MMWEFHSNGALTFMAGLFVFTIGAMIVAIHREWTDWLAATVTTIGWLILLKGVFLLLIPRSVVGTFANMRLPIAFMSAFGIVTLIIGAGLLLVVFHPEGIGIIDLFQ
jgi:hypothetical protein